jgi:hypothetical protein
MGRFLSPLNRTEKPMSAMPVAGCSDLGFLVKFAVLAI